MENKKLSLHTLNQMGSKFYSLWALGNDPTMGTTGYGVIAITPEGKRYLQNFAGFRPVEKMAGESLVPLTLEEAIASL
jgi:hypothetical protein